MSGFRKVIAVLLIMFIGIPVLIGIVWAVGVTRAIVAPGFLSEFPRELAEKIPTAMDETIVEINRGEISADEHTRIWAKAISEVKPTPGEIFKQIGISSWMKNDLAQSLDQVGAILRGESKPRVVNLNLIPLKTAIRSEALTNYFKEVLKKLPPCTPEQANEWAKVLETGTSHRELPPCQPPDIDQAVNVMRNEIFHEQADMNDQVDLLKIDNPNFSRRKAVDIAAFLKSLTFFLFLIPAVMLFLFALIATTKGTGILRWMGVSSLIGGALAFATARLSLQAIEAGTCGGVHFSSHHHMNYLERIFTHKSGDIIYSFLSRLFSSVDKVSGAVCIVGIILIAISYTLYSERETHSRPASPEPPIAPQPPQVEG
ncbi:MAG: hypothetical protein ACM3SY_14395 [Candidatus Omnitrophota bacterium]